MKRGATDTANINSGAIAHIAAYKAHKAGSRSPVYLIGEGARFSFWLCVVDGMPYTFSVG